MKTDLFLEVVTPEQIVFEGPVGMVEVPGFNGRFTLLKNHAPIIASLTNGRIRVIGKDGLERLFECSGGILDCKENHVIILVDKALKQE